MGNYVVEYFHIDDLTFQFHTMMFQHCLKCLTYLVFQLSLVGRFLLMKLLNTSIPSPFISSSSLLFSSRQITRLTSCALANFAHHG